MLLVTVIWFNILLVHGVRIKVNENANIPSVRNIFSGLRGIDGGEERVKRQAQAQSTAAAPAQPCVLPSGQLGHCRPAGQCSHDFGQDLNKVIYHMCVLGQSTVGICCPASEDRVGDTGLAGSLPATAQEDEGEVTIRIAKAENRGCGVSTRPHAKLAGARPTSAREWPWTASVTPPGFQQYCGGVLITDRHVMTAAHCTSKFTASQLFVRLGEYDFSRTDDTRTYNFRVREKMEHEEYDPTSYHHDISLLTLDRPAVFNTYVWPVCLPPPGMDLVNKSAVVIGWGTDSYGGAFSDVLMEVSVPVWEHARCVTSFTDTIHPEMMCAGGYEGGRDACQGDSGGPLLLEMASGRWAAVGVVSWGLRCGEPDHPGVYTRVDQYLGWIVRNVHF